MPHVGHAHTYLVCFLALSAHFSFLLSVANTRPSCLIVRAVTHPLQDVGG
jgi:hypothetical protein